MLLKLRARKCHPHVAHTCRLINFSCGLFSSDMHALHAKTNVPKYESMCTVIVKVRSNGMTAIATIFELQLQLRGISM